MSRSRDSYGYTFPFSINENVALFYPLGLRFFSRPSQLFDVTSASTSSSTSQATTNIADGGKSTEVYGDTTSFYDHNVQYEKHLDQSYVRLYGLTPDTIRIDHLKPTTIPSTTSTSRIILRNVCIRFPMTFNLYVIILQENELLNLRTVQSILGRFVETQKCVQYLRKNARTNRFRQTSQQVNRNASTTCLNNGFSPTPEIVLADLNVSLTSMYDITDNLAKRMKYESTSTADYSTLTCVDNKMACNLYCWRFDDEVLFKNALDHLKSNAIFWSNQFNVPSSMDDDVVRFSFDMLIEQQRRNNMSKRNSKQTMSTNNDSTLFSATAAKLINNANVGNPTSVETLMLDYNRDKIFRRTTTGKDEETTNDDDTDNEIIDIYEAFKFGEWCLCKRNENSILHTVLTRINRTIFDRVCKSMPDLHSLLHSDQHSVEGELADKLYETPLIFLPSIVWDIETIAQNPGTIPSGTSSDEQLVSIAVTIERTSISARVYNLVMVLVPCTIDDDEFGDIEKLRLLTASTADKTDANDSIVKCYRDERSMLFDFFLLLSGQLVLVNSFHDVRQDLTQYYENVACFLVGHNVVSYDFTFIYNRLVFYDMMSFAKHMVRNVSNTVGDILQMYTFNDAQLCIDSLLFLQARMRSLPSFDLSSVLASYNCEIAKGTLDARAIRFFYNALGNMEKMKILNFGTKIQRLQYFRDFLVYNLYDCLSLAGLLRKLSFPVFCSTIVKYFGQSLNTACYKGNSRLLPSLFIGDMLINGRETLPIRPKNLSIASINSSSSQFATLFNQLYVLVDKFNASEIKRPKFKATFLVCAQAGIDIDLNATNNDTWLLSSNNETLDPTASTTTMTTNVNDSPPKSKKRRSTKTIMSNVSDVTEDHPFDGYLFNNMSYFRNIKALIEIIDDNGTVSEPISQQTSRMSKQQIDGDNNCLQLTSQTQETSRLTVQKNFVHPNVIWSGGQGQLFSTVVNDHQDAIQYANLCLSENDLLRVKEKTYIGGMNYALPCHLKDPILMDFNSFYPNIISHFKLDMNNTAVITVLKLLTCVRSLDQLQELINAGIIRIFDYTSADDTDHYINRQVFADERYSDIFQPKGYDRREWYEGIELSSVDVIVASSRLLTRRVTVTWQKPNGSAVDRVVRKALTRRAELKKKRKLRPEDRVLETLELMEKLSANGTYGYLNFRQSAIQSRSAAANVTLLCRNTFSRTKYIIESPQLLRRFLAHDRFVDPDQYRVIVYYIDTDGTIVGIVRRDGHRPCEKRINLVADNSSRCTILTITLPEVIITPSMLQDLLLTPYNEVNDENDDCVIGTATIENYTRMLTKRKNDFTELVNEMLDMELVKLAAEEHTAVAASVFGCKKYTLMKLFNATANTNRTNTMSLRSFIRVKKTGFEKNATLPIKLLYDQLINNTMLLNHGLSLNPMVRFVCKIINHRAILYALFDVLYDAWLTAVRNRASTKNTNDKKEITVKNFATRIPLNLRDTAGKLSEFIERTLRENQYDPGDRAHVIRVIRTDREGILARRRLHDSSNRQIVVYDINDSNLVLLDDAYDNLDNYTPDLRAFLGGHLTYMYECIEGWKTLRSGKNDLLNTNIPVEPIAWKSDVVFDEYLDTVESRSNYTRLASDTMRKNNTSDITPSNGFYNDGRIVYLRTLQSISSLFFTTWLWSRVIREKHRQVFPSNTSVTHVLLWREMDNVRRTTLLNKLQAKLTTVNTITCGEQILSETVPTTILSNIISDQETVATTDRKTIKYRSPHMFLFDDRFDREWFDQQSSSDDAVELVKQVLLSSMNNEPAGIEQVRKFLRSGIVLYKNECSV